MLSRVQRLFRAGEAEGSGVLLRGLSALICIGFGLWLVFAWTNYGETYAQAMDGWRLGGTHLVELTLVREDRQKLDCASDTVIDGLSCGFTARKSAPTPAPVEKDRLSPYKSVKGGMLLGAGLWSSPGLAEPPRGRFTVVCNFHILGVTRSAAVRWDKTSEFTRVQESVPVGRLEGCVIPR